jgi:hypothetical protein
MIKLNSRQAVLPGYKLPGYKLFIENLKTHCHAVLRAFVGIIFPMGRWHRKLSEMLNI